MGLMPLHAAGDGNETTSDYVISSFIPTLKALKYSRDQQHRSSLESNPKMLIVQMPQTIGMRTLKSSEEIKFIRTGISPVVPTVLPPSPSKSTVLDKISRHNIVHFICHGNSDSTDPSAGGLFLGPGADGRPEHLTARDLANINHKDAQIAFLSACSTAENSSEELIDEVIHVASAFQLIGFPHVIGTLWSASDKAAIRVSGVFYECLIHRLKADNSHIRDVVVADALHQAVRTLRDGKRSDLISWAPFIHVGA
jgi:hypothetical protein